MNFQVILSWVFLEMPFSFEKGKYDYFNISIIVRDIKERLAVLP